MYGPIVPSSAYFPAPMSFASTCPAHQSIHPSPTPGFGEVRSKLRLWSSAAHVHANARVVVDTVMLRYHKAEHGPRLWVPAVRNSGWDGGITSSMTPCASASSSASPSSRSIEISRSSWRPRPASCKSGLGSVAVEVAELVVVAQGTSVAVRGGGRFGSGRRWEETVRPDRIPLIVKTLPGSHAAASLASRFTDLDLEDRATHAGSGRIVSRRSASELTSWGVCVIGKDCRYGDAADEGVNVGPMSRLRSGSRLWLRLGPGYLSYGSATHYGICSGARLARSYHTSISSGATGLSRWIQLSTVLVDVA
ncbi:hypothetical protein EDB85DRAFT_2272137 [Lactarius pseudohatsudake]|nr:hypothetical protein EDB85DRAFT_2272137 [Lactarius pseudohatsudake]